ncbi:hypothetical protein B0H14DRAFT_3159712 [Mycena olivaceomarginata]|nr:hypothetical protein B0H14DRAFT_3159712 [Mycena olivaceomarginata]
MPPIRTHHDALPIAAPTPRAFTFPVAHNLADSPPVSPSNSPFEPDLRELALSAASSSPSSSSSSSSHDHDECRTPPPAQPLPLSAFTRTLSPVSAPTSPQAPSRRKSSVNDDTPRPKRGDHDYVKRPENAFILFRRNCVSSTSAPSAASPSSPSSVATPTSPGTGKTLPKQRQADLSKTISQQWKALSPAERAKWEDLAKERKREHAELHPGYVYRPQRSGAKNRTSASAAPATPKRKQSEAAPPPPPPHIEFVVATPRHERSTSAPTPPPHQAVLIPNVYASSSSFASSSPSQSSSITAWSTDDNAAGAVLSFLPDADTGGLFAQFDMSSSFDYMPSFSFNTGYNFEASLQSSDFLRAMFPPTIPPTSTGAEGEGDSPAFSPSYTYASPPPPSSADDCPSPYPSYTPNTESSPSYTYASPPTSADDAYPMEACASASASVWAAASPWGSLSSFGTSTTGGLSEGDFDIGRIAEVGWGGCGELGAPFEMQFGEPQGEFEFEFGGGEKVAMDF